ncbi:ATP-dependent 6-phosphofructokinase [Trichomonascus vanleenenianus]|uniref:6-phosphofructokinase subunit beta n=1 Tax=Trichomonascus vanleenenianus TaxID=2268995 RepID=UPI003ECA3EDA
MSRVISGMSFISFPTSDERLYRETVKFYEMLGFAPVQEYDRSHPESTTAIKTVSTHSFDSIHETWLSALPSDPYEKPSAQQVNQGATIKVRHTRAGPSVEESEKRTEEVKRYFAGEDFRSVAPAFVFSTEDLGRLISELDKAKYPVEKCPSEYAPVEAYTVDPLGNAIGFTSRPNPFSTNDAGRVTTVEAETFSRSGEASSASSVFGGDGMAQTGDRKKKIAIMTSGGDAPGMNAAVRAVVRASIHRGCDAYAIYEGYEGLVKGGDYIKQMTWADVRGFLAIGGTSIGTARCKEFRERDGRLKAAHNLIKAGIDGLIVCGGDGSLTGADRFREEWPSLIKELVEKKLVTEEQIAGHEHLYICGLVGSIDNDMSLTDATIGAYSSLDRICQSVDYIDATAESHSRAFVIEVMGRHCGWLALMAGLASAADYIFIPEKPPKPDEWAKNMSDIVLRHRKRGMRKTIVIVAEGAIDSELNPITSNEVKDVLSGLGLDTRVTTLGHVQRGGTAVAVDRMIATLQGVDAVDAILNLTPESPSPMIGITENKIVRRPLMEAVRLTSSVADAIAAKQFEKAMSLRDTEFSEHLENYMALNSADADQPSNPAENSLKIAIINVGAPAGGMNAALRAAASYCFSRGHKPYAIHNGFTGLSRHESVRELDWLEVEKLALKGGCEIGTNRSTPDVDMGMVAYYFQKYAFDGLIIIGGFEAYHSLHQLQEARYAYPAFRIPMICLPATISNNVPGTEYSIGSDTCLNALVQYCDVIKQSASSTRRRVFVVEVQGGNSGYISAYAGVVTGAHAVYTPEEGISLRQLNSDIENLKRCFTHDEGRNRNGRLVLRNEKASQTFDTKVLVDILRNEADNRFEAREAIPGHVQQGGTPSPMDLTRAARLAIKCVQFLEDKQEVRNNDIPDEDSMYSVIGIRSSKLVFTPVRTLWDYETEVEARRPNRIHWDKMLTIADMLEDRKRVE